MLGRKQQSQVARSFPNRYLFSYTNKVTSLFSDRYIFIIILPDESVGFEKQKRFSWKTTAFLLFHDSISTIPLKFLH